MYKKINHQWELTDTSIMRQWNAEKRVWITQYLRQQIERGGAVIAAFEANELIGFGSIDGYLFGNTAKYANLTMLFVDDRWKRNGIGSKIFDEICKHAERMKADKLFISAIPAVETVDFYLHIGCQDANEIVPEYVDTDQDRYLEFLLETST
jgi:GNAT superfamily N-acetyltransferase